MMKKIFYWIERVCLMTALWASRQALADTLVIEVNTVEDQFNNGDELCSLREAIETVNSIAEFENSIEIAPCLNEEVPENLDLIRVQLQQGTYEIGQEFVEDGEELGNRSGDFLLRSSVDVVIEPNQNAEEPVVLDAQFRDRIIATLFNSRATLILKHLTFRNGKPAVNAEFDASGGAIKMSYDGLLRIENCMFENNQTSIHKTENRWSYGDGGAITANRLQISGSVFQNNRIDLELPEDENQILLSAGRGGAIYQYRANLLEIENSIFKKNEGRITGAVHGNIWNVEDPKVIIRSSSFIENRSAYQASAVFINGGWVERNLFKGNISEDGAVVRISNANRGLPTIIQNNTFYQNDSGNSGVVTAFLHENYVENHLAAKLIFNTFVLNLGSAMRKEFLGEIQFGANIFMTDNEEIALCNFRNGFDQEGSINSLGFNLWSGRFECDESLASDLPPLDENTPDAWAEVLGDFDEERGFFPLVEESLALDQISEDEEICANSGLDQQGHIRPAGDGCDLGAIESNSVPPEMEEGTGGEGSQLPVDEPEGGSIMEEPSGGSVDENPDEPAGGFAGEDPGEPSMPVAGAGGGGSANQGGEEPIMDVESPKSSSSGCQCTVLSFSGPITKNIFQSHPVSLGLLLVFVVRLFKKKR